MPSSGTAPAALCTPDVARSVLGTVSFNADGLVPVIAQDFETGRVLMLAWMNADALLHTLTTGEMCYFSRSRKALWVKGESSGQKQYLKEMSIDCDTDAILAQVSQTGVACHTGRTSCFFHQVTPSGTIINEAPLISEEELYGK